jgi:succinoglycan biosynthesis transport protein ExoP
LANAIATVYLEREFDARAEASKRTSGTLQSRLAELRERLARSAQRVEDFKEKNKIIGASGELVTEQQLSALNRQLAQARAGTAERRARYDDVRRLQRSSAEPDAIAEAIESPTITALRSQYAEAKQAGSEQVRDPRTTSSAGHRCRRSGGAKPPPHRRGIVAHRRDGAQRVQPRACQRRGNRAFGRCA